MFFELGHPDYFVPATQPKFTPHRPVGHLNAVTWGAPNAINKPIDFFLMFFNLQIITNICDYTNAYAWVKVLETPSYGRKDGSWVDVTPPETYNFIAMLLYCGIYCTMYLP